jgi:hypothetical protein
LIAKIQIKLEIKKNLVRKNRRAIKKVPKYLELIGSVSDNIPNIQKKKGPAAM